MKAAFLSSDLMAFVDEQRAVNEEIRRAGGVQVPISSIDAATIRQKRIYDRYGAMKRVLSRAARDELVVTPFGDVLTRCHPGWDPERTIVHVHGGGWTFGSIAE